MVRAIQEGRKTVTRRPVKATKAHAYGFSMLDHGNDWWPYNAFGDFTSDHEGMEYPIACPYGKPGDRLWVRETHADIGCRLTYRADTDDGAHCQVKKWTPAIHMFRRHSRILLEITDVRVERLQDGDGETAFESRYIAEGINRIHQGDGDYAFHPFKSEPGPGRWTDPFDAWRELWVGINGAESWNANPWVWVVEFKRVTP
ncbi:hypothetical protein HX787_10755 [Pseudomonas tolaasii]|uniref:Morphogenetic protein n=2 Tax=Pseudomonas tolaasii TaxID=29442 RepID=A0A7Y8APK8_PSETO|nr:hypothetical protein [Pseudomonas tolaasii]ARB31613.1 hypothetical protein B5P22_02410 [Pseudomonas tolaasii]KAB0478579.1 hypothetical protein F7R12_04430 [Pseudomonas tolaasii]NWC23311.1 hypothetical protein [Pseudomonas tolaasii]NWC37836.1 hypothetical protein [Pseudomonas tolaasii]NWD36328.1 hypothetical protein [Pseudomonas tolaasii]